MNKRLNPLVKILLRILCFFCLIRLLNHIHIFRFDMRNLCHLLWIQSILIFVNYNVNLIFCYQILREFNFNLLFFWIKINNIINFFECICHLKEKFKCTEWILVDIFSIPKYSSIFKQMIKIQRVSLFINRINIQWLNLDVSVKQWWRIWRIFWHQHKINLLIH